MERRTKPAANDLTIPYVRNVMGPVSYTIVHFDRSPGTHAYQLAMSVVYEAGLMIYAEHGRKLLEWPGRELIREVPSAWDETRFVEGAPGSHVVLARRNGDDWYLAGMTDAPRTVEIVPEFLGEGRPYDVLSFRDSDRSTMVRETRTAVATEGWQVPLLARGGFLIRFSPAVREAE